MDYLERNIKTYSQKTVLVPATKGSPVMFLVTLFFWTIGVVAWRYLRSH